MAYKRWTALELEQVSKGIIPNGRTHRDCWRKAYSMGMAFPASTPRRAWTDKELEELRNGIVPEGRTVDACIMCAYKLGFSFGNIAVPSNKDIETLSEGQAPYGWTGSHAIKVASEMGIAIPVGGFKRSYQDVSVEDLKLLKEGIQPKGWKINRCRWIAHYYGMSFSTKARTSRGQ